MTGPWIMAMTGAWATCLMLVAAITAGTSLLPSQGAHAQVPAKKIFGREKLPAVLPAEVHGFYSKGCFAGGIAIPINGPNWQAMRLSRNRRWGHPDLIKMVVKLSQDGKKVGWNGLLVGDLSQPRGGPMLTGHASHQIGLDADIWLTQMPDRRLTRRERERLSATSVLARKANGRLSPNGVGPHFTNATFGIIKTAAEYKQVERVLVHPAIKRELCRREIGDRTWLHKVRPYFGHHYHMHIRLSCPADSPNCRPQSKPKANDGCGKELDYWHRIMNPRKRKPKPKVLVKKPKPKKKKKVVKRRVKREIGIADLPAACLGVLHAAEPLNAQAATLNMVAGQPFIPELKAAPASAKRRRALVGLVTTPTFRPD